MDGMLESPAPSTYYIEFVVFYPSGAGYRKLYPK